MSSQKEKLAEALKMEQAIKDKKEAWILLAKMNEISDKVENIKSTETQDIRDSLVELKKKIDEYCGDITYEVEII